MSAKIFHTYLKGLKGLCVCVTGGMLHPHAFCWGQSRPGSREALPWTCAPPLSALMCLKRRFILREQDGFFMC